MIALGYFFIVSILGLFLRLYHVSQVDLTFLGSNPKFLTHAHSHAALLGWVYLALTTLIYNSFLDGKGTEIKYRRIFIFGNIAVMGMILTFPKLGYAPPSITFSTLYLIVSYFFAAYAFKHVSEEKKNSHSWKTIKAGLFYLILSSLGAWAIGPITVTVGPESFWHDDSLYFFLHFLSNGFVLIALAGVVINYLEENKGVISDTIFKKFFIYINAGTVLTYFLNTLWAKPPAIFFILAGVGAVLQGIGLYYFLIIIYDNLNKFKSRLDIFTKRALLLAVILLIAKMILQVLSAIPYFAELVFIYKDFIIGYLHMIFLGVIVPMLLIFLRQQDLAQVSTRAFKVFYIGFFLTEALIFYRGFAGWLGFPFFASYYNLLAACTLIFPLSLIIIFGRNIKPSISKKKLINDIISFFKLIY